MPDLTQVLKANPYHDPKTGKFTTGPKGGGQLSSPAYVGNYKDPAGAYTHTDTMSGRQLETLFYKRGDGAYDVVEFDPEDDVGYWSGSVTEDVYQKHMTAYAGHIWEKGTWINPRALQDSIKTPKYVTHKSETPMTTLTQVMKFNPYHDPKSGRFSSKGGAKGGGTFTQGAPKTNELRSAVDDLMASYIKRAPLPNAAEFDQKILAAEAAGDKKLAKKLRDDMDRAEVESRGMVRANDLKKGTRVSLRNGFEADLYDNGRGNTRLAKVYGDYTEIGSVYTKDILEAKVGDGWKRVALSAAQRKAAKKIRAVGW